MSAPDRATRSPTGAPGEGGPQDNSCSKCGLAHGDDPCPLEDPIKAIAFYLTLRERASEENHDDSLHRLAEATEGIYEVLARWDEENLLRAAPRHGSPMAPALEQIANRLDELVTLANVTPADVERLGLAHPGPPVLGPIEHVLSRIADSLGERSRSRPSTSRESPEKKSEPKRAHDSFANREARRHAGGPA